LGDAGSADPCTDFTWDPRKAKVNLRKHRGSFVEAAGALTDPLARYIVDSEQPDREIGLGSCRSGRVLVVVFSEQGEAIRIISARQANRHERKEYEEG
jgi:uncharacterized DUF497 family protein